MRARTNRNRIVSDATRFRNTLDDSDVTRFDRSGVLIRRQRNTFLFVLGKRRRRVGW